MISDRETAADVEYPDRRQSGRAGLFRQRQTVGDGLYVAAGARALGAHVEREPGDGYLEAAPELEQPHRVFHLTAELAWEVAAGVAASEPDSQHPGRTAAKARELFDLRGVVDDQ